MIALAAAAGLVLGWLGGCLATRAVWRRSMRTLAATWLAAVGDDDDTDARAVKALAATLVVLGGKA